MLASLNIFNRSKTLPIETMDIDIQNEPYNPASTAHEKFIQVNLKIFAKCIKELEAIDKPMGIGVGTDIALWLSGMINLTWSIIAGIGMYLYVNHLVSRPQYAEQFQKQLHTMLDIYNWCRNSSKSPVIRDKSFLAVLEAIAPYIEGGDLHLYELYGLNFENGPNKQLLTILAKPPHELPIPYLVTFAKEQNYINTFFYRGMANAKRAMYGIDKIKISDHIPAQAPY